MNIVLIDDSYFKSKEVKGQLVWGMIGYACGMLGMLKDGITNSLTFEWALCWLAMCLVNTLFTADTRGSKFLGRPIYHTFVNFDDYKGYEDGLGYVRVKERASWWDWHIHKIDDVEMTMKIGDKEQLEE